LVKKNENRLTALVLNLKDMREDRIYAKSLRKIESRSSDYKMKFNRNLLEENNNDNREDRNVRERNLMDNRSR
jgi:hypothetical protein